jgi:ketosteroid isomerase-like protein
MTPNDVLDHYFRSLRAGDLDAALESFTDDTFYSHSAYDPGLEGPTGSRVEAWGKNELKAAWELRGDRDWQHHISVTLAGDHFYLEGEVSSSTSGQVIFSFLSSGRFAADGRIASYVEYDARPPVGATRGFR